MPVSASSRSGSAVVDTGRPPPSHVPRPTMRSGVRRSTAASTVSRTSVVVRGAPVIVGAGGAATWSAPVTAGFALGAVMLPRRLWCAVPLATAVHRHDLPRVRATLGVEHLAEAAHGGERLVREDQPHVVEFVEPDAMLSGDRAAGRHAGRYDLPHRLVNPGAFVRIVRVIADVRMEVAVARVKHVAYGNALARGDLVNGREDVRQPRSRNDSVLNDKVGRHSAH